MEDQTDIAAKWLHLPIEWFMRELPAKLLLGCFAAAAGYRVMIGDQKLFRKNIHRLPRGLYLRKSFTPGQYSEIEDLIAHGMTLLGNDEEFFAYYGAKGINVFSAARVNESTMDHMKAVFVWGERLADIMDELFPGTASKMVVTGTARLDLYRPEFRQIYAADAARYRDQYGPFILFNSNLPVATAFDSADDLMRAIGKIADGHYDEVRHYNDRMFDFFGRTLKEFIEAIPRVKAAFPNHKLVIRPHPVDRLEVWNKVAQADDGIVVVRENHVAPWLLASEAMFHHGCSTAIEGWLLGTPVISYQPDHDDDFTEVGAMVSDKAETVEELVTRLREVAGKRDIQREGREWMEECFAGVSGPTACERTVAALDRIAVEPQVNRYGEVPSWKRLGGALRLERQFRYLRDRYMRRPARTMHMGSSWKTHPKWPHRLSVDDIERKIADYSTGHPNFAAIRVSQIDDALFVLSA